MCVDWKKCMYFSNITKEQAESKPSKQKKAVRFQPQKNNLKSEVMNFSGATGEKFVVENSQKDALEQLKWCNHSAANKMSPATPTVNGWKGCHLHRDTESAMKCQQRAQVTTLGNKSTFHRSHSPVEARGEQQGEGKILTR